MTYILFNYYFGFNSSFSDGKKYLCFRPNSNPSTLLVWRGGGIPVNLFVCMYGIIYLAAQKCTVNWLFVNFACMELILRLLVLVPVKEPHLLFLN